MDSVALVRYEGDIRGTLEKGLTLLGGLDNLKSPVIIKPNICTISDDTGFSVSKSDVTEALIGLVMEENSNLAIRIVESDSESKYADEAFEKFGYSQLVDGLKHVGTDISLVNLSKSPTIFVPFEGNYFNNPTLPEIFSEPRYMISVAVAKTHSLTFLTGALKNQFGLLPRKNKNSYHSHINGIIVDLNCLIQPDLCIVDARMGVEGWNGPKIRPLGVFIIGKKPASVDATLARIMQFEPERIPHLVKSSEQGLGTLNPTVKGVSIDSVSVGFNPPK
ncbi:MAG: DUF362 domain-containing protein [Candidatus Thorarchaeota archaeon]|jgi:uncharacterized protein (DUF362 family)